MSTYLADIAMSKIYIILNDKDEPVCAALTEQCAIKFCREHNMKYRMIDLFVQDHIEVRMINHAPII